MSTNANPIRRTSAALACVLLLGAGAAKAAASQPFPSLDAPDLSVLKHLPAGHDELVFRGENAQRSFAVYLSRGEVDRVRTFQLGLKNTVALLPDRSAVRLTINGNLLATIPARSTNGIVTVPVAIPAGVLVPGLNKVDVDVAMTHRVDCSVAATYELWTSLEPAQTGFLVPASAAGAVRSIDELSSEPLSVDGTTRIYWHLAGTPDAAAIGRAGRFIDALVSRAGLTRPVIEAGPGRGQGAGLDVILTTSKTLDEETQGLQILGRQDGVSFARDRATDRLVLIMSGVDQADLDTQIAEFAAKVPATAARGGSDAMIDGQTRKTFAELGLATDNFTGRHYTASLDVSLPSDFYPANYDKARLLIDAAFASTLDPDSGLVFRVNGALVSSMRLGPDRGGVLQHEMVELPLRFFHPGHNEIGIEGTTTTAADRQCDTLRPSVGARFTLANSSELDFPRFAHLGTTPQIPGAMAIGSAGRDRVNLYMAASDPVSIGSGLTVLANRAAEQRPAATPLVHIGSPSASDVPGIVVAPLEALPVQLATPLRAIMAAADKAPSAAATANAPPTAPAVKPGEPLAVVAPQRRYDAQAWLGTAQRFLKNQGFFFGVDDVARALPFRAHSLMVAAVDPRLEGQKVAGMDVPRFTTDPSQWLVVTAPDMATIRNGLTRLVSDGQWKDLNGQAVSLDADNGQMAAIQPSRVLYVMPNSVVLSDLRPILGGIVSNHIELSLAVLMLLMAMLGLSTYSLIRRAGSK